MAKIDEQSVRLNFYLSTLSSQYQFKGANSKAVMAHEFYDRTFIEEDNSNLLSLKSMGVNFTSLIGNHASGCVRTTRESTEEFISTSSNMENIMEIGSFWRKYTNQLVVFTGHGFIEDGHIWNTTVMKKMSWEISWRLGLSGESIPTS
jgi:hypothetical protein